MNGRVEELAEWLSEEVFFWQGGRGANVATCSIVLIFACNNFPKRLKRKKKKCSMPEF